MDRETLATTQVSRRQVLAGSALGGFSLFLAACGTTGTATTEPTAGPTEAPASTGPVATLAPGESPTEAPPATPAPQPDAEVNWANWTYYIDVDDDDPNVFPTLEAFTERYGTVVNYSEIIDDNEDFFGKVQPALQGNADTGWDIVTLTDWMAARLIRLGWVETFDLGNMPNFTANLVDTYKGVNWDPDGDKHAPWQSGMTGIGFDPKKTGDLTSLAALFTADSRWNGKVDYLTEMRDAVGLAMLYLGLDPANPTRDDCDKAVAVLQEGRDKGILRAFRGNAYAQDLARGNVVLAMAWSGDMIQLLIDKPGLKFAIADEGGMLWTDNSLIPKGAVHKYTAELLMDWYYQPDIAAAVTTYVNYICPVKGTAEILMAADPEIASNPLIFPTPDMQARLHIFGGLSEEDERYFNQKFAKVTGKG